MAQRLEEETAHDVSDDELIFDRELPRSAERPPFVGSVSPEDFDPDSSFPPPLPSLQEFRHVSHIARKPAQQSRSVREGQIVAHRYYVEQISGRSGLAHVVHVRHVELGQRLLLKYLPAEACALPELVMRFLEGAREALELQSEHTARTVDAGRLASGEPYVVSELLAGRGLGEMLRVRGALGLTEAVDVILQAAESVAEAHARGMVHGSLGTSSVFLTRRPDGSTFVKVLDFGVAKAFRVDTESVEAAAWSGARLPDAHPLLDALAGATPEQIRRAKDIDARTDVWALGALLHEALSGFPAHHAETASALIAAIVADPPPPLTSLRHDVPAALERVVLRCLEKERSARFASVAELAVALKPFASPEGAANGDRIVRTLGRSTRPPPLPGQSRALVYVGPSPSAPRQAATVPSPRFQLIWSTGLVAFGLVGGSVAGAIATRGALPQATTSNLPAMVAPAVTSLPIAPVTTGSPAAGTGPAPANPTPPVQPVTANVTVAVKAATPSVRAPSRARPAKEVPSRTSTTITENPHADRLEPPRAATGEDLFSDMR